MTIEGTFFDKVLHLATAVFAVILFLLSFLAYRRDGKKKFLFICLAFLLFAVKEVITAYDVWAYSSPTLVGISHLLNFLILGLIFWGVVK